MGSMQCARDQNLRFGLYLADLRRDQNDSHGIINYAVGLCRALVAELGDTESLVIYANDGIVREISDVLSDRRVVLRCVAAPRGLGTRLLMDHVRSVLWSRRDRLSVIHYPKGFLPVLPLGRVSTVASIHDDIPLQYAKQPLGAGSPLKRHYFGWLMRRSLRTATRVVTLTEYSADRLQPFRPAGAHPVAAVGLGVDAPLRQRKPRGNHFLHLGSGLPHKRSRFAVDATLRYIRERDTEPGELLVTGRLSPDLEARTRAEERVSREPGPLTTADLQGLMETARAVVFTSSMEGFGLPPVEAYLAGTPAVWARATSVPEVMGDTPGGFSVDDPKDFGRALDEVLSLSDEQIAQFGSNLAKRFSWTITAERVISCYRQAAKDSEVDEG